MYVVALLLLLSVVYYARAAWRSTSDGDEHKGCRRHCPAGFFSSDDGGNGGGSGDAPTLPHEPLYASDSDGGPSGVGG
jgi:hypothetical protein